MLKAMLRLSSLRKTLIGTLMMTKATSSLNNTRDTIGRHEGRRKKGHEHEQSIKSLPRTKGETQPVLSDVCEAFCLYTPFDPEAAENEQVINVAFVGQAQENIRQKLQKLEGFTEMNASQLLKVATKVFVNQDQEVKWEANRKMKKKVDLLAAAPIEWSGRPQQGGLSRGRDNHHRLQPVLPAPTLPQDTPAPGRN
jgi:hypothetical protein